jgi:ribosome-binding factor A
MPSDHGSPASRWPDRKVLQLCAQVERTLGMALSGCGDELLQQVAIESVRPSADEARLTVTIAPPLGEGAPPPREILAALERARGMLRAEVAAAVSRRRAPDFLFRFAPPETAAPDEASASDPR